MGQIPSNRLYADGLKILSLFPMPNVNTSYNYEGTRKQQSDVAAARL